jgi:hypothetical protein
MTTIIVKKFDPHFNRAMGKVILNERQYKDEMKRGGYISFDECKQKTDAIRAKQGQVSYDQMGDKAKGLAKAAHELSKRGRGNEKPSDRMIDAYKDLKRR